MLTGLGDSIKCDNTLDTRAKIAIRDLEPVVRYLLFPSCRSKVLEKPATYVDGLVYCRCACPPPCHTIPPPSSYRLLCTSVAKWGVTL
jgi:hypothetical protein